MGGGGGVRVTRRALLSGFLSGSYRGIPQQQQYGAYTLICFKFTRDEGPTHPCLSTHQQFSKQSGTDGVGFESRGCTRVALVTSTRREVLLCLCCFASYNSYVCNRYSVIHTMATTTRKKHACIMRGKVVSKQLEHGIRRRRDREVGTERKPSNTKQKQ